MQVVHGHINKSKNIAEGMAPGRNSAMLLLESQAAAAALIVAFFFLRKAGFQPIGLAAAQYSMLVLTVSYVSSVYGFQKGLLSALLSSFYFFALETIGADDLSSDLAFAIIAASAAFLFGSGRMSASSEEEPAYAEADDEPRADASAPEAGQAAESAPPAPQPLASEEMRREDFMGIARSELSAPFSRLEKQMIALKDHLVRSGDARAVGFVHNMEQQFRKIDKSLQKLFKFARIDFDNLPVKIDEFDAEKLFTEAVDAVQKASPKHRLIFLPEIRSHAVGDRFKVRKVLDHLLRNAMKYSPEGGKIVIGLREEEAEIVAYVRDHGVGMDDEQLEAISAGFSSGPSDASKRSALGIGLYTSNEIVRRLGGTMWVKGKKGKGTAFHFSLPKAGGGAASERS